jgi:hypothetical protein
MRITDLIERILLDYTKIDYECEYKYCMISRHDVAHFIKVDFKIDVSPDVILEVALQRPDKFDTNIDYITYIEQ